MPSVRAVWLARWHRDWHRDWDWQVSMPSVRAVWLARRNWLLVDLRSRRFNALGAGGVARADLVEELPVAGILVSMPSVRAVWLARALIETIREVVAEFQCPRCGRCGSREPVQRLLETTGAGFNALGAGGVARAAPDESWNETWHEVSMPSVRAVWLARRSSGMCTTRRTRFQCPRCGRCGSRVLHHVPGRRRSFESLFQSPRCGRCGSPSRTTSYTANAVANGFNALGAGGVARAMLLVAPVAVLDTGFNALGAGGVARAILTTDRSDDGRKRFNALGAGGVARAVGSSYVSR